MSFQLEQGLPSRRPAGGGELLKISKFALVSCVVRALFTERVARGGVPGADPATEG